MDVQATPSPYASLGAPRPAAGNAPALGQQVPGHTGGLPAQGGLSVLANPMAEELRSKGRGEDTMLVHMTPNEVNSLQGLAMATGGSLTINPHTGLPEAGWLGKLLPTILGAVGMAFGIPPVWMGAAGAVGGTLATGDLGKGLSMGLQAFGGASMAGGLGLNGAISKNAFGLMGNAGSGMATAAAKQAAMQGLEQTAQKLPGMETAFGPSTSVPSLGAPSASAAGLEQIAQKLPGMQTAFNASTAVPSMGGPSVPTSFFGKFGEAAKMGLPGGIIGKAAPMLAAQGIMTGVSDAMTPTVKTAQEQTDNSYTGPYYSPKRKVVSNATTESILKGSGEQQRWFDTGMPEVFDAQGRLVQPGSNTAPGTPILQNVLSKDIVKPGFLGLGTKTVKNANKYVQQWVPWMGEQGTGYAEGGEVHLAPGSFVMPARETTEFVKGGRKGQEVLAQFGGIPIKGPGDGVSDSIPARIGGKQEARVADGEVYFPPEAVKRIGGGDQERGTKKLYALMRKAEKSRKTAPRGGKGLDLLKDLT